MKALELEKTIGGKKRTIKDLVRFASIRNERYPNYSIFLGAGASISSEVRSGAELVEQWRKEEYLSRSGEPESSYSSERAIKYLTANHGEWYDKNHEYSTLFENKYDLPRQRRYFVENEVADKFPSIGYAYLTRLIEKRYFNTVFTTNFDDLMNEAIYRFSDVRPIVCGHDSGIESITVTSERPKIIKLHGDYLFDDIKSTTRETESLEINMKNKLMEFLKEFGLIVVGYSGSDRSIMDPLFSLVKKDAYLKSGLYWCLRREDEVCEDLKKLLLKDRVYYVYVDGFDELMAEFYLELEGNETPINTMRFSNQPKEISEKYNSNEYLINSKHSLIRQHLSELQQEQQTNTILEAMKSDSGSSMERETTGGLDDAEFLRMVEVQRNISLGKYELALQSIEDEIAQTTCTGEYRVRLLRNAVIAYKKLGDLSSALKYCDSLIEADRKDPSHYLEKSRLLSSPERRIDVLTKGISKDEFYSKGYSLRGAEYLYLYENRFPIDKEFLNKASSDFDKSLSVNPSVGNTAWIHKLKMLTSHYGTDGQEQARATILDIVKQVGYSGSSTGLIVDYCEKYDCLDFDGRSIPELFKLALSSGPDWSKRGVLSSMTKASIDLGLIGELQLMIEEYLDNEYSPENDSDVISKSQYLYRLKRNPRQAIDALTDYLEVSYSQDVVESQISILYETQNFDETKELLDRHSSRLDKKFVVKFDYMIASRLGQIDDAIQSLKFLKELDRDPDASFEADVGYIYLENGEFENAKVYLRKFLERSNFCHTEEIQIVNYEYACIKLNKKADKARLNKVVSHGKSEDTKAVARILLGDTDKAIEILSERASKDYAKFMRYSLWPILEPYIDEIASQANISRSIPENELVN